ncbi:hypothetical protein AK812_SmicGene29008 [Symbiodinium microadriaticum]|uniref:Uncharacterized protein n=1 Tax=Symbiodinium microadriaticum TaxID=2951 RepID=A0A1Q9D2W5_SYMMI|nr:hypothetical protein AK812_SmicGene29008 [Symbiodinium microadriaticum]
MLWQHQLFLGIDQPTFHLSKPALKERAQYAKSRAEHLRSCLRLQQAPEAPQPPQQPLAPVAPAAPAGVAVVGEALNFSTAMDGNPSPIAVHLVALPDHAKAGVNMRGRFAFATFALLCTAPMLL